MSMPKILLLAVLVALSACGKKEASASDPIKVAAASDLAFAFKEVGAAFENKTGKKVTFTFGSTGQLAKQIAEGAPYDVFAAANVSFVDEVVKEKACDGATKAMYARGRIVVWTKKGTTVAKLNDLTEARFVKIAIANPEHAPYGKAAKQALEAAGIWGAVQPRIVYGENISQTLQFAQTGNVEAAIAALSLAKANDDGEYMVIDEALHKPIDQALVVCKRGVNQAVAKEFAAFVNSDEGRAIMKRFGFLLPGESA
jgi:molybdate transport system substrate-binding protein